ncbi:MAG TPA: 2-isopropylmalate synthase [Gemmatimonadaceae bacterium]|nr:2-isopropylmalate synthase [Gemmatimonadaceae bacterium]
MNEAGPAGSTATTDRVRIFDTTLRDGEQAPGCTMSLSEKLEVARQLARLGVDVIEAGFPATSSGEADAVRAIAEAVGSAEGPVICGLARASMSDIEVCAAAVAPAARRRIHTFMATSDLHLSHKLRISRAEVLRRVPESVAFARTLADDVEFSPEDATRSDPAFLCEVLHAALEAGTTTLNIPDTVGYATPDEYRALIARVVVVAAWVPGTIVSTHCHDDLGLAVANSLAGVRAGARQVECTVNGIGERAGNASLEEIAMALDTRASLFGTRTGLDTRELSRASRIVAACTGVHMPPNKAIVGANAFAHEAGIHQDGMLKHRQTYEIMTPESVGADGTRLVLGRHSGRRALQQRLGGMGYDLGDEALRAVFARFKELADRKKVIDDRDLAAIVAGEVEGLHAPYELVHLQAACGTHAIPTATVRLRSHDGVIHTASATGTGSVDAACRAVNVIAGELGELCDVTVRAATEGIDAVGEVRAGVRDYHSRRVFTGHGVHTDLVVAACQAYVGALNWLLAARAATNGGGSAEAAAASPAPAHRTGDAGALVESVA